MSRFFKVRYELVLLGIAMIAVTLSLGWFWRSQAGLRRIKSLPVAIHLAKSKYHPDDSSKPEVEASKWLKPRAQSAGAGWIYELCTPPTIFYDRLSKVFTVTPPSDAIVAKAKFDLELVAIRRDLYRVQLAGYFGEPGAYTAVFTQPERTGTLNLREGGRLDALGLVLRNFSVQRIAVKHADEWPVYEVAARAELYDEHSASTVTLDSLSRKFADTPIATIRISSRVETTQDVREGDVISTQDRNYRIERIQFSPAEVLVTCSESGTSIVETKVLRLASEVEKETAAHPHVDKKFSARPATGLVITDK